MYDEYLFKIGIVKRPYCSCVEVSLETDYNDNMIEWLTIKVAVKLIDLSDEYGGRPYVQKPKVNISKAIGVTFCVIFSREKECDKYIEEIRRFFNS